MQKRETPKFKFNIFGHENTLALHKNTVEFTKDTYLTKRGDCILGINSDFNFPKTDLKKLHDKKILIEIKTKDNKDSFSAYLCKEFVDEHEAVIRKSDFKDYRTFAIKSNKAAKEIDREIVKTLTNPNEKAKVTIKKIDIKNIIFDFDNTLEDWTTAEVATLKEIVKLVNKYYKKDIKFSEFHKLYNDAKIYYISHYDKPKYYAREYWLGFILKKKDIKYTKKELDNFTEKYWNLIDQNVTLFPNSKETIKKLYKQGYKLFMYSDSDGTKEIKDRRIKLFHIDQYFKGIYTSDDTGYNKPNIVGEKKMITMAHINPHETIFVGDHPESDHKGSKELGMTTVWIKKGFWSDRTDKFSYVDFEINDIKEVQEILKNLK